MPPKSLRERVETWLAHVASLVQPTPNPHGLTPESPLRDVGFAWLTQFATTVLQHQHSLSTLENYGRSYLRFGALQDVPVTALRSSAVLDWYDVHFAATTSAMASMDHRALRACLAWARKRDLVFFNAAEKLGISHTPEEPRPMRPSQVSPWRVALEKMMERRRHWIAGRRPNELDAVAMFSSLRALGLLERSGRRIKEICTIEVSQCWPDDAAIILQKTKTGPSVIPLLPDDVAFIRQQLAELDGRSRYLFPSPAGWDRHISTRTVWETHHEVCGLAGLAHVRPHELRHGFAWAALRAGAQIGDLSRAMGHRDIKTTQRKYGHGVFVTPGMYQCANLAAELKREGVQ